MEHQTCALISSIASKKRIGKKYLFHMTWWSIWEPCLSRWTSGINQHRTESCSHMNMHSLSNYQGRVFFYYHWSARLMKRKEIGHRHFAPIPLPLQLPKKAPFALALMVYCRCCKALFRKAFDIVVLIKKIAMWSLFWSSAAADYYILQFRSLIMKGNNTKFFNK